MTCHFSSLAFTSTVSVAIPVSSYHSSISDLAPASSYSYSSSPGSFSSDLSSVHLSRSSAFLTGNTGNTATTLNHHHHHRNRNHHHHHRHHHHHQQQQQQQQSQSLSPPLRSSPQQPSMVQDKGREPKKNRRVNCSKFDLQFQRFLTQRAVQTLIFYNKSVRDTTTGDWLEAFMGHHGIGNLHAINGLKVDSDQYLRALLRTPPETLTVRMSMGFRGGTKGNPYLTEDKYTEYDLVVDPRDLGKKLFDIREHLAREFEEDLRLIQSENNELMRHHREVVQNKVDELSRYQLPIFENNPFGTNASPLRTGSYDLLKRLLTTQAIQKVLDRTSVSRKERHTYEWLDNFFNKFGSTMNFQTNYNMERDFLKRLLNEPPVLRGAHFIDTLRIAEEILEMRAALAIEHTTYLQNVATEHLKMKKELLESFMTDPKQ